MEMSLVFGRKLRNCLLRDFLPYSLISFVNSNFAKDPKNYKLVINYCFFLNREIVFWYSKKQRIISASITKAKYISLGYIIRECNDVVT